MRRTEYYSPGVGRHGAFLQMTAPNAYPPDTYQQTGQARRFTAGRTVAETWNLAVYGPAFPYMPRPAEWAGRLGDQVRVSVPMFTDQDPRRFGFSQTVKARTTLHRDGVLVGESPSAGSLRGTVPAGRGAFRLHTRAQRADVSELSTDVSATRTFASDTVAGETAVDLPLLAVRFALRLDDRNRASVRVPGVRAAQRGGRTA
ncbi:hypothetical protein FHS29_003699 [Saccharothrix tamanrassetensis]|uniref:Uncharacterized protein n=1 Tax=Saccharothrix tamanrassetensis TaxID=1051531 RepID=A0A841CNJ1_9PSEU|nr:hypothetical protein [Saccharothrix tamanrassetensis]MBB5957106.1 hypothetical protein [Saccharothrix tamanrassetensis]